MFCPESKLIVKLLSPKVNTLAKGGEITFTCECRIKGKETKRPGAIHYQWLRDEMPIISETKQTLTITDAGEENEGSYSCRVTDECLGTVSTEPVKLIVIGECLLMCRSTLCRSISHLPHCNSLFACEVQKRPMHIS